MRRDGFTMTLAVMEAINTPQLKTHIMYKSNVNNNTLEIILVKLTEKGIAEITTRQEKRFGYNTRKPSRTAFYVLTEKGRTLLKTAQELMKEVS